MHRWIVATFMVFMTVAGVSAQTLYLPAAANADGVNQTRWLTDLEIKAEGDDAATFVIELLESTINNNDPLRVDGSVGPGECLRLSNVLESEFGFNGTAALRVTATSGRIIANSRTFNDDPGGTYGQTVPAVDIGRAAGLGSPATLIQLSRSADPSIGFRTNIGVVNVVGEQTAIEIDIHAADGTLLGTITRTLKPFEYRQLNDVFATVGATEIGDGYAVVRTTSEDGRFISYASVVDNKSGDAVFILGAVDVTELPLQERLVVFESFMRPG
jgi:hypothetical protein